MNRIKKTDFKCYIRDYRFTELFNELGWNYCIQEIIERDENERYHFEAVAEKAGFIVFVCIPTGRGGFPDYNARKKMHKEIAKLYHEHLIIFVDQENTVQIWQLSLREADKPERIRETKWFSHQDPELLYQRLSGIFFALDEEDNLTIVDVSSRVRENFAANAERLTKRFYERFKKEHKVFLGFIEGITDQVSKEWYASLMLNRLMFCYFIQRKGFLDNDRHYLSNKLAAIQAKKGNNKFYTFYRTFLLTLFHEGLGAPVHSLDLQEEIGNVPYLNGGLFDVHMLEKENADIQIADKAFQLLFDFFDEWEWYLDVRPDATGNEINPDVIGYIFEKYINDRAQMGAYYTKEDITGYIGKNCIIPFLFDETRRSYPEVFKPESPLWQMPRGDPDRYIYDAVKKGVELELPSEIAIGLDPNQPDLLQRRENWNKLAPPEYALPTEIWRETVERRSRYFEVKSKLEKGEIKEIDDFITYNLNILQFAQDAVEDIDDPVFIRHFYKALLKVTILDPTCGSGAFLFAALNILEPLYNACLQRMESYTQEGTKRKHVFFEQVCLQLREPVHPNLQYFIYKNIILNNLYGVDIMNEAVEIAKLRLFLKLMSCVDPDYNKPNLGLEPLPDIDFNIRCGNTLVGFATQEELNDALTFTIDGLLEKPKLKEKMQIVADAYRYFKTIQLTYGDNLFSLYNAKKALEQRLTKLNGTLNKYLASRYSINTDNNEEYQAWLRSHKPFHWFAEFYEIITGNDGFDVIIGNPPYVEWRGVTNYNISEDYNTLSCQNLYAFVIELNSWILSRNGRTGMIVPHSAICTDRMAPVMDIMTKHIGFWLSTYCIRPSKLFEGADQRLAIYVAKHKTANKEKNKLFSTRYHRWYHEYRPYLFNTLAYVPIMGINGLNSLPKAGFPIEQKIWGKLCNVQPLKLFLKGSAKLYYHNAPRYWVRAMTFIPYFWNQRDGQQVSTQIKKLNLCSVDDAAAVGTVINSSLFYWWFILLSDCRHLNRREIENFLFDHENITDHLKELLVKHCRLLMADYKKHSSRKEAIYRSTGKVVYDEFYPRYSKPIIDGIDNILARYYRFSSEELDFIINYDIKYRMSEILA